MLENINGFIWGVICTLLCIDIFSNTINVYWWIWLILIIIMLIVSFAIKLYLYITDYKELATSGYSIMKKIVNYFIAKRNKKIPSNLINKNLS